MPRNDSPRSPKPGRSGPGSGLNRRDRLNIWYIFLAILAVLAFQAIWQAQTNVAEIPYSRFETQLEEGKIASVRVGSEQIRGEYREPQDGKPSFVTARVEQDIAEKLEQHDVEYSGVVEETWLTTLLSWIIPVLIFVAAWLFIFRKFAEKQGLGGPMSIGKSKAKIYVEKDTRVSFDDVAGVDEAKQELAEIVDFLKNPDEYGHLGARIPKGVLLVGPPGTGKTLLARALAGEAGVTFFSISGSEFVEMFVGVGAARVRDLFEQARKNAPAIIFVDELDALGRARGMGGQMGSHDEREQTLQQLLNELDGFDPSAGIVLLAATNRPEVLDPALLRAGRFDRQVLVDKPDRRGRAQILKVHMKKAKVSNEVDLDQVAAMTTGFTGADLANLVNEAALLATRRKAKQVEMRDFTAAVERIVAGLEKKNRLINDRERRIIAHHEMGHALVGLRLKGADEVHKVSIIPRGIGALGYTIQRPTEDRYLMTRDELETKLAVLLGGRAAEKLIFDHTSTGASDDLARSTDIARAMVTRYGMDPEIGHAAYERESAPFLGGGSGEPPGPRRFSEATAQRIDQGVKAILDAAFDRALGILEANREVLERCAAELLERETLEADDLRELTRDMREDEGGKAEEKAPAK